MDYVTQGRAWRMSSVARLFLALVSLASVSAHAVAVTYKIGIANGANRPPYNYCVAKQSALVDVVVLDASSGAQLKSFSLVPLTYTTNASLSFVADDSLTVKVTVTPRQSEYGVGLPTDAVACDPTHQVDVPLQVLGAFSRTDADGNSRGQSAATVQSGFGFSGVQTGSPGTPVTIQPLALVFDAACESPLSCSGQKLANINGRGSVTAVGAASTSGIVQRHGLVADGISQLIFRFPTTKPVQVLGFGELLGPYVEIGPGGGASGPLGPPLTSSLKCPLGQIFTIGSPTGRCDLPISTVGTGDSQNTFTLQAPIDFPDDSVLSRNNGDLLGPVGETRGIELSVFEVPSPGIAVLNTWDVIVDLARPPVVLIHGLWSNSGTWNDFVSHAYGDGNYDLLRRLSFGLPDYGDDLIASDTFDPASKPYSVSVVEQAINEGALAAERAAGFAASAVDAVGHSMGGLQVRSLVAGGGQRPYARADNYYAGSIHKLVTLGTPHLGAPIARELMKNRCATSALLHTLTTYTYDTGFGAGFSLTPPQPIGTFENYVNDFGSGSVYFGPALQDLQPGSDALLALGATAVPTHVIGSDVSGAPHFAYTLVDYAATVVFGIKIDSVGTLGSAGDWVVPLPSQLSGLSNSDAAATVLTGLIHYQETGDLHSYQAIDSYLRSGTTVAGLIASPFATQLPPSTGDGGALYTFDECPSSAAGSSSVKRQVPRVVQSVATAAVAPALSPPSGTEVSVGQTVTLSATLASAVTADFIFDNNVIAGSGAQGQFTATVQIPPGSIGRLPFTVVLNDGNGNITQLKSYLSVSADLTGAKLVVSPQAVTLAQVGSSAAVLATATLPNATSVAVDSTVPGVTYHVVNSGSLRNVVVSGDTVLATRKGTSTLTISLAGSSVSLPITVLSNGFTNHTIATPTDIYQNVSDPRTVLLILPLPGDLTAADLDLTHLTLTAAGTSIPVTIMSYAETDKVLVLQASAAKIAATATVGPFSVTLTGLTADGAPWTSTASVQIHVDGAIVPDLVGQTQANSSSLLTASGLSVGTATSVASTSANIGIILSQSPGAGSVSQAGSAVDISVSSGVSVPSVTSKTQSDASSTLSGAGLSVGAITTQASSSVPSGSVISQNPASGTNVNPGTPVELSVSSGPAPSGKGGGGAMDYGLLLSMLALALSRGFLERKRPSGYRPPRDLTDRPGPG